MKRKITQEKAAAINRKRALMQPTTSLSWGEHSARVVRADTRTRFIAGEGVAQSLGYFEQMFYSDTGSE